MSRPESLTNPLADVLAAHFAALIERGEADVVVDDDAGSVELQTDVWTLHLEGWPIVLAFVAIDSITESEAEHTSALQSSFAERDMAFLSLADRAVESTISQALFDSGDGLSIVLAKMIRSR